MEPHTQPFYRIIGLVFVIGVVAGPAPTARLKGTILFAYPGGEELFLERNERTTTLKPPGPRRAGHPTYQSLARNGDLVATSYVKTPYPHYSEGIAVYSFDIGTWHTYDGEDFQYVWSTAFAPDSTAIAA